ncbi:MAG: paraquat-inducible protein A [Candidatus Omnitrophica bacterium]|nr:paraquat-inducible protein A [Candidatus Omnitrophota bacterium]
MPKRSLAASYPKHAVVPFLIFAALVLLILGLSLPLMTIKQQVLWKRWENHYSVFTGALSLAEHGDYVLAGVLFFFSMVFPIAKLLILGWVWWIRLAEDERQRLLHWLEMLGKWSMLDVFVVAILIVLVKLGPLAKVEPRDGVYFFCAAIIVSMLATMYVDRFARRHLRPSAHS